MKKNAVIIILLLLTITVLKAQSNYRPGYIITVNNDTIRGLIDFRTDEVNAKVCKFKLSETSKEQSYHPGEIAGFRYIEDGKYYVSRDFLIEGKQEKIFWEYLVQGILSLYFLERGGIEYYSFEDELGNVTIVPKYPDKQLTLRETGNTYMKQDNQYMGIVRYLFRDNKSVSKAAESVKFNHPSMINLTKKYHDEVCTTGEECIVFETKVNQRDTRTKFSLYGGWQRLSHKFGDEELDAIHCLSPVIGSQLNFSYVRWQKSLSLQMEVSLSQLKGKIRFERKDNFDEYFKYQAMVAQGKFGGKYTYHKGKIRPLAEAGISLSYLFAASSVYHHGTRYQVIEEDNSLLPDPLMSGYYIGTGVDYQLKKDNFLLFRITFDDQLGASKKVYIADKMTAWQLKLGYTF